MVRLRALSTARLHVASQRTRPAIHPPTHTCIHTYTHTHTRAPQVTELSRYCIKNPLKSDLLFGEWMVRARAPVGCVYGVLRR